MLLLHKNNGKGILKLHCSVSRIMYVATRSGGCSSDWNISVLLLTEYVFMLIHCSLYHFGFGTAKLLV